MSNMNFQYNEAPPVGGSKWFAHLPIPKKLIYISLHYAHFVGGGGGGLAEFDAEFKFAKIQNSHFVGGGGGGGLVKPTFNF